MKVLYVSRASSEILYEHLTNKTNRAAAKFNYLIAKGLSENNSEVFCCFNDFKEEKYFNHEQIITKNVFSENDNLYFVIRKYASKNILSYLKIQKFTSDYFRSILDDKDTIIVCDYLCITLTLQAMKASKRFENKIICICTDLPEFLGGNEASLKSDIQKIIFSKIAYNILNKFDYYVLLTKQMHCKLGQKAQSCPYIVVEGVANSKMSSENNELCNKRNPKVILYAGSIDKKYGIDNLVKGFNKTHLKDVELHIYGDGDFVAKLSDLCKLNKNIKYFGTISNDKVVNKMIEATLLVNPRPTNQEFTKYSFPSKNIEYMSTGTPLLTTILPGMPKEYYKYIYLLENETPDGISKKLIELMSLPAVVLHSKGKSAKNFIINNKNEIQVSNRIINMIKNDSILD